jgi:hypothetical protein
MYFHSGKFLMTQPAGTNPTGWLLSAIGDVHGDFKAKAHIGSCWFFPIHTVTPDVDAAKRGLRTGSLSACTG